MLLSFGYWEMIYIYLFLFLKNLSYGVHNHSATIFSVVYCLWIHLGHEDIDYIYYVGQKILYFFYTCCCFSMQTNIDKHRGNHEVITQSPASEQEVEQGNNQGYKGMIHSSVLRKASCRCDYNVQNAGINLVLCLHVPSLHLLFIAFSIASSCSTNPVAFALVLSCKIASKKHLK